MKPRKELRWFVQVMESKLQENKYKGRWKGCRFAHLFSRLRDESDELLVKAHPLKLDTIAETLTRKDADELIRECADIANFAMMIADNIRVKADPTPDRASGE